VQPQNSHIAPGAAIIDRLKSGELWSANVRCDDGVALRPDARLIEIDQVTINELFSVGTKIAFHVTATGPYLGGLDEIDARLIGTNSSMAIAGLVDVPDIHNFSGHITRDRLGLMRSLQKIT
jgi:hypothetical protein